MRWKSNSKPVTAFLYRRILRLHLSHCTMYSGLDKNVKHPLNLKPPSNAAPEAKAPHARTRRSDAKGGWRRPGAPIVTDERQGAAAAAW